MLPWFFLHHSVCSCLGRRPGFLSRASCTLLLGDEEGNTSSSSSWPGHRLFPRGVQILVAVLSPCRGCPALTQMREGGKALSRATLQPNTALTWKEPGPKGVSGGPSVQCGLLSQEPAVALALQGLAQPHFEPASAFGPHSIHK